MVYLVKPILDTSRTIMNFRIYGELAGRLGSRSETALRIQ